MKFDTKREAAQNWVNSFTRIPDSVIYKLHDANENDLFEITPKTVGDVVYVYVRNNWGLEGEVIERNNEMLKIKFSDGETIEIHESECETANEDYFPMWGTMWAFDESLDNEWLEDHLVDMADCGFRIYESEDYGHVFGIDGAGYDFYEEHWIPLYDKRGLRWHKEEE